MVGTQGSALAGGGSGGGADDYLVYVGTYTGPRSKGIYAYRMDMATGSLAPLGLAAESPSPSFLETDPQHRFLYAVNELTRFENQPTGAVSAFAIDPATGKLTLLNQRPSGGTDPCHVAVDLSGRNALVANYSSGSVTVLPIGPDGRLMEKSASIQHRGRSVNPDRQAGPHAHCIALPANNRFAFVCDLGTDKVFIYRFDSTNGTLTPNDPPFVSVKAGAGPRHLAFHPDGRHAYLINELHSTVTVFDYDSARGSLHEVQTVPALPGDFKGANIAAEIAVHPSGKFLYASNRGHDGIAVFAINPDRGTLTCIEHQSTQGKTPRHFVIDPSGKYLLAANQDSGTIVEFRIDNETGRLKPLGKVAELDSPVCILFVPQAKK